MGQGCIALLNCEEGVVYVVGGSVWEEKVRGVRWGEEGDIGVSVLNRLIRGGDILFIKGVEFGLGGVGGSRGRH
jgi:hypothetical protein